MADSPVNLSNAREATDRELIAFKAVAFVGRADAIKYTGDVRRLHALSHLTETATTDIEGVLGKGAVDALFPFDAQAWEEGQQENRQGLVPTRYAQALHVVGQALQGPKDKDTTWTAASAAIVAGRMIMGVPADAPSAPGRPPWSPGLPKACVQNALSVHRSMPTGRLMDAAPFATALGEVLPKPIHATAADLQAGIREEPAAGSEHWTAGLHSELTQWNSAELYDSTGLPPDSLAKGTDNSPRL